MEEKIIEGNKLIAEFMNIHFEIVDGVCYPEGKHQWEITLLPHLDQYSIYGDKEHAWKKVNLKYHASWDWLMSVVEKIRDVSEEIGDEEGELYIKMQREEFLIFDLPLCTPIEEVWESAIEFITWYNQNKQP